MFRDARRAAVAIAQSSLAANEAAAAGTPEKGKAEKGKKLAPKKLAGKTDVPEVGKQAGLLYSRGSVVLGKHPVVTQVPRQFVA